MLSSASTTQRILHAPRPSTKSSRRHDSCIVRSSTDDDAPIQFDRRSALISGGLCLSMLAVPELAVADSFNFVLPAEKLSAGQANLLREQVQKRAQKELANVLTAADAPFAMRLVFNDAATYEYTTKTGGFDGSIVLPDELSRPENAMLKPLVAKLTDVKKAVDEANAADEQGPISWADLLVLAARLAVRKEWLIQKRKRTSSDEDAQFLTQTFGTDWPVRIGRVDADAPAPAGRIPSVDAPVEDIRKFLLGIGAKPDGGIGYKPPFYERPGFIMYTAAQEDPTKAEEYLATDPEFAKWKKDYDKSRKTLTRTNYEVDFVTYFTRLTTLGAKFDSLKYLKPVVISSKKKS